MTHNLTLVHEQHREDARATAHAGLGLRMPQYPRIAEVLRQVRLEHVVDVQQPAAGTDGAVPKAIAAAAVVDAVAADQLVIVPPAPMRPASMAETLSVVGSPERFATVLERDQAELTESELDELIAELGMRDIAREALRARMVSAAINARQRSAYELVFLMLAFSVMVLVSVPPLVQLALALRGNVPG